MATFKPNQRVKRIKTGPGDPNLNPVPLGMTGTIAFQFDHESYKVVWDAPVWGLFGDRREMIAMTYSLAPLTDPDSSWADEQIAKLKNLVREPLPVHPSQLEETR